VADRTSDGRPIRMLTIVDEFTRECLAIDVAKRLTSEDVLERLTDLFAHRGVPKHIRSDNGAEFTAKCVWEWLGCVDDGHKWWCWVVSASPKLRLASWPLRLCDDDGHRGRLRQLDCSHQPDDP